MSVPKYWLSSHNPIGTQFKVPGDDEIYFIALKSPLSAEVNKLFPENKRWGPAEAMKKIVEPIKSNLSDWIFTSIELSDQVDPPNEEWEKIFVGHHHCPISHDFLPQEVESFINLIKPDNIKRYKNLFIISCNNGHDRCGVAISMYLNRNYNLNLFDAYSLFKKNRYPGIYSEKAVDFLNKMIGTKGKAIKAAQRKDEFQLQSSFDIKDCNLKIEDLPDFKYFGFEKIKRDTVINNFNDFLNRDTSNDSFIKMPEADSPKPIFDFLEFNESNSEENETLSLTPECLKQIKKHAYRCSFVPSGIFLYVMAFDPNLLVVNYGFNKYWGVPCRTKSKLPFICTAYAIETSDILEIFLTDLLYYQSESLEKVELDNRITTIYYDILPNIEISKKNHINIKYRPMGRMTDLVKLYDYLNSRDAKYKFNFRTAGFSFIQRSWPPGRSIFVPFIREVHLIFILNSNDIAVLYARADDNQTIVPVKYFSLSKKDRFDGLHKRVVKFVVVDPENPDSRWKPLAICKNRLPDYISYVKAIVNSKINDKNVAGMLKTIEETVKQGVAEKEKQAKSKSKSSKK